MKRSWNWSLWIGFLFALGGFLSYTFFAQFPVTRDFPWANLLLFAAGGIFLVLRLFGNLQHSYRLARLTALCRINNFSARASRIGTTARSSRSTTKDQADPD
jgi:hypothetical protein